MYLRVTDIKNVFSDVSNATLPSGQEEDWLSLYKTGLQCVYVTHGWKSSAASPSVQMIVKGEYK